VLLAVETGPVLLLGGFVSDPQLLCTVATLTLLVALDDRFYFVLCCAQRAKAS
jgi:hypothetical protein